MSELLDRVRTALGDAVLDTHEAFGDDTVLITADGLVESMRALRDEPELAFNMLLDLTGVDSRIDRRLLSRRPAEGGATRMEHDKQDRCRTTATASLPRIQERTPARVAGRSRHRDLNRVVPLADEQAGRLKSVFPVQ